IARRATAVSGIVVVRVLIVSRVTVLVSQYSWSTLSLNGRARASKAFARNPRAPGLMILRL
ncbi:hypothetical protein Q0P14_14940, partial [Staphylococcus aureus]|nr:hypothetical protein [Staphylococcus aureus]